MKRKGFYNRYKDNAFLPFSPLKWDFVQSLAVSLFFILLLIVFSTTIYQGSRQDYIQAIEHQDFLLSESDFNIRDLNLWHNMAYYLEFKNHLMNMSNVDNISYSPDLLLSDLPKPRYPLFNKIYYALTEENLPPLNMVDIIKEIRQTVSAGLIICDSEGQILRLRPNSREFVDFQDIPFELKKAFVLVEDDNFFIQPGGVDVPGLMSATFHYFFFNSKKGNASITEQIFEMYIGQQQKTPLEKLVQIFGALYYTYYTKNREDLLSLYLNSIPGSFWGDHCYGIQSIMQNYLNKTEFSELSHREIAWLTRIALHPNVFGQNAARYYILKQKFQEQNLDIHNQEDVKTFIEALSEQYVEQIQEEYSNLDADDSSENETDFTLSVTKINEILKSHSLTVEKIESSLLEFFHGNNTMSPLLTDYEYSDAMQETIAYTRPIGINNEQVYTDQTLKDIVTLFGPLGLNIGLEVEVALDQETQQMMDTELDRSRWSASGYYYTPQSWSETRYGGGAILIRTHNIQTMEVENKIIALSSKHTNNEEYYNWAVEGLRHFGSIYKWPVLMLYLDQGGTVLDQFWDVPREISFINNYGSADTYIPDNYRVRSVHPVGYYDFNRCTNIRNFVKSKNVSHVHLAEIVGLDRLSEFFNACLFMDPLSNPLNKFREEFPVVLGSMETSSVEFAQILSVISNRGILKPLTTIISIKEYNGKEHLLDMPEQRLVSREAAEAALYMGYLNPYFGTANRFILGGIGKTGTSDTDVSFAAMTGRTPEEYIEDNPDHMLNSNLLYLVNIGVNNNKISDWLYGGKVGAINANRVMRNVLQENINGRIVYHPISGNLTSTFSDLFEYQRATGYWINGRQVYVPVLPGTSIYYENSDVYYRGLGIIKDFVRNEDIKTVSRYRNYVTRYVRQWASENNIPYSSDLVYVADLPNNRIVTRYIAATNRLRNNRYSPRDIYRTEFEDIAENVRNRLRLDEEDEEFTLASNDPPRFSTMRTEPDPSEVPRNNQYIRVMRMAQSSDGQDSGNANGEPVVPPQNLYNRADTFLRPSVQSASSLRELLNANSQDRRVSEGVVNTLTRQRNNNNQ